MLSPIANTSRSSLEEVPDASWAAAAASSLKVSTYRCALCRQSSVTDEGGRQSRLSVLVCLVHRDRAAAPIAGGTHPFGIGAMIGNQLAAQRLGNQRLAGDPGVVIAGRK